MARIRKIEKRTLPSGLVSYRAPYTDASGVRRSKNFATAKEAKAFLLKVGNELVQGTHTPTSTSITVTEAAALWIANCERQESRANDDRELSAACRPAHHPVPRRDQIVGADHHRGACLHRSASRGRPVGGHDPASSDFARQYLQGSPSPRIWWPPPRRRASTGRRPIATIRARRFRARPNCRRSSRRQRSTVRAGAPSSWSRSSAACGPRSCAA